MQSKFPSHIHFMWHTRHAAGNPEFTCPLAATWPRLGAIFAAISYDRPFVLRSFVLMGNHFHGIAQSSLEEGEFEYLLLHYLSPQLPISSGEITLRKILTFRHYLLTYKYVYRNPVESGFCSKVEGYPYSTLQKLFKNDESFPVLDNLNLLQNPARVIGWLNNQNPYFYQTTAFSNS